MIFEKLTLFTIKKKIEKKNRKIDLKLILKNGVLSQDLSKKVKNTLDIRYKKEESNSSPMNKSNHRSKHADNFLKRLNKFKIRNKSILEIGCGSGYLLERLVKKGAQVTGVEPSNKIHKLKKIKIVKNISKLNKEEKFDFIISNAVIEHIFNLDKFFQSLRKLLKDGGKFFFCVPDCEYSINSGDPTMLNHEHISYFTNKSLSYILKKNKFNAHVYRDQKGNLFCHGNKLSKKIKIKKIKKIKKINSNYYKKFFSKIKKFEIMCAKYKKKNIIFYGATSAITNIFSYLRTTKKENIDVIDGDIYKQNKYISGLNKQIKNPDYLNKLKKNNVIILIIAIYFEKEIKKILTKKFNITTKNILTLKTL